jgi:hypothetical protein
MDATQTPLTDEEIVVLVNLLVPIVTERRNKEPHVDFPEDALLAKLVNMRQALLAART